MSEPRRFYLDRAADPTGVSGTGHVADGVLWPDGTASVRWCGEHPSAVFWDRGQASVELIHGHGGATRVVWLDDESGTPDADTVARGVQSWIALDLHQALNRPLSHAADCENQGFGSWSDWWADLIGQVRNGYMLAAYRSGMAAPTPSDVPDVDRS